MRIHILSLFLLAFLFTTCNTRQQIGQANYTKEVTSPNGDLVLKVALTEGRLSYQFDYQGNNVLEDSKLGVIFEDMDLSGNLILDELEVRSTDERWTQPWGEQKEIRDHHEELTLFLRNESGDRMNVVFRVFDDGLGFRYEWPEQPQEREFVITDEQTEFNVAGDPLSWWIGAYKWRRYEHIFKETTVSEIDTVHTPFTMRRDDGLHVSIHEAALTDFASMTLAHKGNSSLEADLVPWRSGEKVVGTFPHRSPWRTIALGNNAGALMTNYLVLNLNEPSKIDDPSWIKTGKYTGIWWDMHLGTKTWHIGERHGATTEYVKKLMDFTADHGFYGVLVEGWNKGWRESDGEISYLESYPDFDLQEVTRYGDERGVKLIGHHETWAAIKHYESQVDSAFSLYNSVRVEVVKTGYVKDDYVQEGEWHHGQYMVRHYRDIVKKAARHQIMLNVHEPIKDTGIRRTWPNMMTREGARGQEYNAWSEDGGNPVNYTTIVPFTRGLVSPFDYTPGVFDILLTDKPDNPNNNRIHHTLAHELALYVVIYSPFQMVADLYENLEAEPVALDWVERVGTDWETTLVPEAEIGEYAVVVRKERGTADWFLGGITNEMARTLDIELGFLAEGQKYEAIIYSDGEGADWKTNPFPLQQTSRILGHTDTLKLELASGGGAAVHFSPVAK